MLIFTPRLELKMWENTPMKEAKKDDKGNIMKDEKGKVINTDKIINYTTYHFREIDGTITKIMTMNDSYRSLEGEAVIIALDLSRKEFKGKSEWKASIKNIEKV